MATHYLIACSNRKAEKSSRDLEWRSESTIAGWSEAWSAGIDGGSPAREMYVGDSFSKQCRMIEELSEGDCIWIVSAGGGLVKPTDLIPSYQSTFTGPGPSPEQWSGLPHGGLERIPLSEGDRVVLCIPEPYQKAVAMDDLWGEVSDVAISIGPGVARESCPGSLPTHPRLRELLRCGAMQIWTHLLEQYLESDDPHAHFSQLVERANGLPEKPDRETIDTAEELDSIVDSLPEDITSAGSAVRYIRDELLRAASQERVAESWSRRRP